MVTVEPLRGKECGTKKWSTVNNSTGQDISFDVDVKELQFFFYVAGGTTMSTSFKLTAPATSTHHDALTITQNPWTVALVKKSGDVLFNLAGVAGNVDIHCVILR